MFAGARLEDLLAGRGVGRTLGDDRTIFRGASANENGLAKCQAFIKLVAGAGFEPTTFGL